MTTKTICDWTPCGKPVNDTEDWHGANIHGPHGEQIHLDGCTFQHLHFAIGDVLELAAAGRNNDALRSSAPPSPTGSHDQGVTQ